MTPMGVREGRTEMGRGRANTGDERSVTMMDASWPVNFWIPAPGRLPDGVRVYAVPDLHGRADLLERLLDTLAADMARAGDGIERLVAIFLGDYIDRGPRSRRVLDILTNGLPKGLETVFLKGNHEDFVLSFLDGASDAAGWLLNGGIETLASYGVDVPDTGFLTDEAENSIRVALLNAMPERHLVFLRDLALMHREGDYLFAHAGVRPGVPVERQNPEDLLWIRGPFLTSTADLGAVVVHGHTITPRPLVLANRIGLDTGAYQSGRLTCGVLEADRLRFIQT